MKTTPLPFPLLYSCGHTVFLCTPKSRPGLSDLWERKVASAHGMYLAASCGTERGISFHLCFFAASWPGVSVRRKIEMEIYRKQPG
jgi:hypothetical protein